ncbi:MAG: ADOP family duplicated permease [Acidobacteriota bacterium]
MPDGRIARSPGQGRLGLAQDFFFALRFYRRRFGQLIGAALTLALGIGANVAVFQAVNGVLLRPLPFPNSDRLVAVWEEDLEKDWRFVQVSPADFLDYRQARSAFLDITAHSDQSTELTLSGAGEPQSIVGAMVYGNFFSVLEAKPLIGRVFREEESWEGHSPVVLLSYGLWHRQGGDPAVLGRTVRIDGISRTVVGVMPDGFSYPFPDLDVWLPFKWQPSQVTNPYFRSGHSLRPIGRLRKGISLQQGQLDLATVAKRLSREFPTTNATLRPGLTPLKEWIQGNLQRPLLLALGSAGMVLLIACLNLGILQLALIVGRRREIFIRTALGAGRFRMSRQLFCEGLLLSFLGGGVGTFLGTWTFSILRNLAPSAARLNEIGWDSTAAGFAFLLTLLAGVLLGIAPTLRTVHLMQHPAAMGLAEEASDVGGKRVQSALVVLEVALAVVLVASAVLLGQSQTHLLRANLGADPEQVLTARISLPPAEYFAPSRITSFFHLFLERSQALPGVVASGWVDALPSQGLQETVDVYLEGRPSGESVVETSHRIASGGYFAVLKVPLLKGRLLAESDVAAAPQVALINAALEKKLFHGANPLGSRISLAEDPEARDGTWYQVVGVVGDERLEGGSAPARPEVFTSYLQTPIWSMRLTVRSTIPPRSLTQPMRRQLGALDRNLAFADIKTLREVISRSLARERFVSALSAFFAVLALVLAALGTFTLTAYSVASARLEIGVRLALGSTRGRLLGGILGRALLPVAIGVVLGLALTLAVSSLLRGLLFGIGPRDGLTLALVALTLLGIALAASLLAARRAVRLDILSLLRRA